MWPDLSFIKESYHLRGWELLSQGSYDRTTGELLTGLTGAMTFEKKRIKSRGILCERSALRKRCVRNLEVGFEQQRRTPCFRAKKWPVDFELFFGSLDFFVTFCVKAKSKGELKSNPVLQIELLSLAEQTIGKKLKNICSGRRPNHSNKNNKYF